jgi:CxxC-x17-CxxC domain-containing protein
MSEYETKILKCVECTNEFAWTAGEQQYFADRGLQHEPKRCKQCRDRRNQKEPGTHRHPIQAGERPRRRVNVWTNVECADCGAETQVPFKPTQGRPVYCRACLPAHQKGHA